MKLSRRRLSIQKIGWKRFFSDNFNRENGSIGNGWITSSTATIFNNKLLITPSLSAEMLDDPGLEGTYTNGIISTVFWAKSGSPTVAQSTDIHGGSKAQQFQGNANGDGIFYFTNTNSIAHQWYRGSYWAKRLSGTARQTRFIVGHKNGTGLNKFGLIDQVTYTQYTGLSLAISTTQMAIFVTQGGATLPSDQVVVDDFSIKKITNISEMGVYRTRPSRNCRISITLDVTMAGNALNTVPVGIWGCADNPANPQNGVVVFRSGNAMRLYKVVSGVWTNLLDIFDNIQKTTISISNIGNAWTAYANSTAIGVSQTINDFTDYPYCGIFCGDPVVPISRFDLDLGGKTYNVLGFGDSKTTGSPCYLDLLGSRYIQIPTKIGTAGVDTATRKTTIDADLVAAVGIPDIITYNLGANDSVNMPTQSAFTSNTLYVLDAMHAKWPAAKIYLMRVWRRTFDANCDTINSWIDAIVTARSTFCFAGPDERIFIKNGDDGITYSSDGIHPNTQGLQLTADQWRLVLGY